jgi:NO-binding membrane sensor protein with MHYT domain
MGGVSIWSMHYIGNRAIVLYGGASGLQLSYGAGFTVLSLFIPIIVLLLACLVVGSSDKPTLWRFILAGTFGSAAICGMHYLVFALFSFLI